MTMVHPHDTTRPYAAPTISVIMMEPQDVICDSCTDSPAGSGEDNCAPVHPGTQAWSVTD